MKLKTVVLGMLVACVAVFVRAEDAKPVCNCKPMGMTVSHAGTLATDPIGIKNFLYDNPNITITQGDTITWTNNDAATHTATSDKPLFDTGSLTTGQSASFTFNTAGTFPYHCSIHPFMTATITVLPKTTGGSTLSGTWTGTLKGKAFSQTSGPATVINQTATFTLVQTGTALTASVVIAGGSAVDLTGTAGNGNFVLTGGDGVTTYVLSGHVDKLFKSFSGTAIIYNSTGDQEVTFKAKRTVPSAK